MESDNIINDLIKGGIIGAALGALIANDKKGVGIGAIAGAALFASLKANENAKKTNIPILIQEKESLFKVMPNGDRIFIKKIPKPNVTLHNKFILK
jgi:hypothetical protein